MDKRVKHMKDLTELGSVPGVCELQIHLGEEGGPRLLVEVPHGATQEAEYHARHSRTWVLRLGDGTAESRARMQTAFDELFPYLEELLESDAVTRELTAARIAPDPSTLHSGLPPLSRTISRTL